MAHAKSGFTIAEILIAIAIVGLIMAVGGPAVMRYLERGRVTTTKQSLRGFKTAIESFNADTGQNPEQLKDLIKKPAQEEVAKDWAGPYLDKKEVPKDGWKRAFMYKLTPGQEHEYELYSYGPKGKGGSRAEQIHVWDI